jgi:hypothetical protein
MTSEQTRSRRHRRTASTGSRLFAVRVWTEEVLGSLEYRGHVRDALSGAFCNFRDWSTLEAFLVERMREDENMSPARTEDGS